MEFRTLQTDTDFQDILDLLDSAFPVSREYCELALRHIAKHPEVEGVTYGLWSDGELIGTLTYGRIEDTENGWDGEGFMRFLAVAPNHRRKGHATWMIRKCLADLKAQGCPCVCVAIESTHSVGIQIFESFEFYDYGEGEETYDGECTSPPVTLMYYARDL